MKIAAPSVLVGEHISVAGRHGVTRRRKMQIEPRTHVHVAGFSPIEAWMREGDFSSADEQGEKGERREPMRHAHQPSVALRRRDCGSGNSPDCIALCDWHSCVHDLEPRSPGDCYSTSSRSQGRRRSLLIQIPISGKGSQKWGTLVRSSITQSDFPRLAGGANRFMRRYSTI